MRYCPRKLFRALVLSGIGIFLWPQTSPGVQRWHSTVGAPTQTPPAVLRTAAKSVFVLTVEDEEGRTRTGMAFLIAPHVLVTCFHLLGDADTAKVRRLGQAKVYEADVKGSDQQSDFGMLMVEGLERDTPRFADLDAHPLVEGDTVFIPKLNGARWEFHQEKIEGQSNIGDASYVRLAPSDAEVSEGAPVLNARGEVVGLAGIKVRGGEEMRLAVAPQVLKDTGTDFEAVRKQAEQGFIAMKSPPEPLTTPGPPPTPPPLEIHVSVKATVGQHTADATAGEGHGETDEYGIYRFTPAYPAAALEAGVSGDVVVDFRIDDEGQVVNPRATKGPPLLIDAAVAAAKRWKFVARPHGSHAASAPASFVFEFELVEPDSQPLPPRLVIPRQEASSLARSRRVPQGSKRVTSPTWVELHPGNCALTVKLPDAPSFVLPSKSISPASAAKRRAALAARGLKDYRTMVGFRDTGSALFVICYAVAERELDLQSFSKLFNADYNDMRSVLWSGPGNDDQSNFDYDAAGIELKYELKPAPSALPGLEFTGTVDFMGDTQEAKGLMLSQGNRFWVVMASYAPGSPGAKEAGRILDSVRLSTQKCEDESLPETGMQGKLSLIGEFLNSIGGDDGFDNFQSMFDKLNEVATIRGPDGKDIQVSYKYRITQELMAHATRQVNAVYPENAPAKAPAAVLVKVWIDEQGNVVTARGIPGTPAAFIEPAEAAARQWTFRGSKPVPARSVGIIEVQLNKKR